MRDTNKIYFLHQGKINLQTQSAYHIIKCYPVPDRNHA